jgi:hypothetical protein
VGGVPIWIDEPKDAPLEPFPGTVAADTFVRQCPEGKIVPASLWFKNAPEGEMLREMKHSPIPLSACCRYL